LLSSCSNHKENKENTSAGKADKQKQEINLQKTNISMAKPIYLTKAEFLKKVANYEQNPDKWVYLGDKPCIIDFYADWCGPCKMLAPILEELALEYEGRVHIYKVNVDKEQELSNAFNIQSIPSILFVPVKNQPRMVVGYISKDVFKQNIENFLLSDNDNVTK